MRFLYSLNIAVTGALAAYCLLTPGPAAATLFGDSRWSGVGHGRGSGTAYQMLGSWWAAVCLVSLLGLRSPHKYRWGGCLLVCHRQSCWRLSAGAQRPWCRCPPCPAAAPAAPSSSSKPSTNSPSWAARSCRWRPRHGGALGSQAARTPPA